MGECRELAGTGSSEEPAELSGDDRLFTSLVSGCSIQQAAASAGISERTAYRRLADSEFKCRVDAAREGLRESILAKLAGAGDDAITTLRTLMTSDDVTIKYRAAKSVLDSLLAVKTTAPKVKMEEPTGRVVVFLPDDGREGQ